MGNKQTPEPDIAVYNNLTPSETAKMQNDPGFRNFITEKNAVMTDPNAPIEQILKYSAGAPKEVDASFLTNLDKTNATLSQITNLNDLINK